ncbi:MAG: hypothetical protein PWQ97_1550, partial [Tepidanaerobacteraceae bacterium]|nr:hypothetical protein [Tepidanaerobacteraceae bacterium]
LNKNGLPIDDIHALANITVLNERTNVSRLSGKPPWKYVLEYNISRGELDEHFIPGVFADASAGREIVEKSWGKEDLKQVYGDFVLKRAELLSKAANEFLSILKKN